MWERSDEDRGVNTRQGSVPALCLASWGLILHLQREGTAWNPVQRWLSNHLGGLRHFPIIDKYMDFSYSLRIP